MNKFKTFISFEGIDYCGKSTQINLLLNRLKNFNLKIKVLREPGGTLISEKVRDILLDTDHIEMYPNTELLLYSAARSQLVHQIIIEELKRGIYIIADRFFDSTTTYQGYGRNIDIGFIQKLNHFVTSGLTPFKTFFIDISPTEAERRSQLYDEKKDRMESESIEFYQKIRNGYLKLEENEPERFIKINGELPPEQIAEKIWDILSSYWPVSLQN